MRNYVNEIYVFVGKFYSSEHRVVIDSAYKIPTYRVCLSIKQGVFVGIIYSFFLSCLPLATVETKYPRAQKC